MTVDRSTWVSASDSYAVVDEHPLGTMDSRTRQGPHHAV
jgi:hypothetical protein